MNSLLNRLSPSATNMIRMDHTKVMAVFHRYKGDSAPATKRALVETICTALEIHAQLEEEIFYPAMRSIDPSIVEKNVPEHDRMRQLIGSLRNMEASSPNYDRVFMELMREVIRHVADEETTLLPRAEQLLGDRLGALGVAMAKRKVQLTVPRAGEMARNTVRAQPAGSMLLGAGAVVAATFLLTLVRKGATRTSQATGAST